MRRLEFRDSGVIATCYVLRRNLVAAMAHHRISATPSLLLDELAGATAADNLHLPLAPPGNITDVNFGPSLPLTFRLIALTEGQ